MIVTRKAKPRSTADSVFWALSGRRAVPAVLADERDPPCGAPGTGMRYWRAFSTPRPLGSNALQLLSFLADSHQSVMTRMGGPKVWSVG